MPERVRRSLPDTSQPFLTSVEVARLLKVPRSTVEDYARRGLLPSVKLGRHRRYVWEDVRAALLTSRDNPAPGTVVPLPQRRRSAS